MQERAIVWFVIAWLACWDIDLLIVIARGPLLIDPILKFIVVTIALVMVLWSMMRNHWLFP